MMTEKKMFKINLESEIKEKDKYDKFIKGFEEDIKKFVKPFSVASSEIITDEQHIKQFQINSKDKKESNTIAKIRVYELPFEMTVEIIDPAKVGSFSKNLENIVKKRENKANKNTLSIDIRR
ncbi:MAG: hypothetical protein QXN16_03995 [Candidatus Micrarchaeaceae archaeon]